MVIRLPGWTSPGYGPRWAWWSADDADDARARRLWHGSWRSRTGAVGSSVPGSSVSASAPGPLVRGSGAAASATSSRLIPGNTLRLGQHALH
jgi:hypothetical protein